MQKAQGALEYLLLIGGAVLVAVIVITLMLGIVEQGQADAQATANSALSIIEQKRNEIIGVPSANDYIVTFTADNLYSRGTVPPIPAFTTVIIRANGTQVGPSLAFPIESIGISNLKTYIINIPKNEINSGTGAVTKTLELYYNPSGCYGTGCAEHDINLRVRTISVTNTNWDTALWEKYTYPFWGPWTNGTNAQCSWSDCVQASLIFN